MPTLPSISILFPSFILPTPPSQHAHTPSKMPSASQALDCGHVQRPLAIQGNHDSSSNSVIYRSGADGRRIAVTRCPSCICHAILEASLDGLRAIPYRYLADMDAHVRLLCVSQNTSDEMRRQLYLLRERVWCARDVDELRRGVVALAGYFEVSAWFRL